METEILKWFVPIVVLVVSMSHSCVHGAPKVPCFFIFGDSQADDGNNNPLPTLAKVNYPPYGVDFPGGQPTGRFSNGKNSVDIIAELLGFASPIPPAATTLSAPAILTGLNYASGGAGIRLETGLNLGAHISLDDQLKNHQQTVLKIDAYLKANGSLDYMKKCLYSVGMGSNDFINNYFSPAFPTRRRYSVEQFTQLLIDQYTLQISGLYTKYGARKVALVGLGQIGCTPFAMQNAKATACVPEMNNAAQVFNQKLVALVDQLNAKFTDAKFIYVNSFGITSSAVYKVQNVPCCPMNIGGLCVPFGTPCPNRNDYAFWDGFHPTESLYRLAANRAYTSAQPTDNHPMDISHLVQLAL